MNQVVSIFNQMMEKDFFSQWMNLRPEELREGYCRLSMLVRKEMLNGHSILHGGVAFAMADSAFAFAANSYGRITVSINASMVYSRAAKEGELLIAEAKTLQVTHKTASLDVTIANKAGKKYYYFRGIGYRTDKEFAKEMKL